MEACLARQAPRSRIRRRRKMNQHEHRGKLSLRKSALDAAFGAFAGATTGANLRLPLLPQAWPANDLGSAGRDGVHRDQSYSGPSLSF